MMDERQKVVQRTFTRKQLLAMPVDDLAALVGEANSQGATFRGTAVVRKADGTIRYADDAVPGDFGESPEDMARVAKETG